MKYANIYYPYGSIYRDVKTEIVNIGDTIQALAIDNLYQRMGIKKEEIVRIARGDLATYNGEYVILPINSMFSGFARDLDVFAFSEKIIPVFLGLAIRGSVLSENDIQYLHRFEPIGCRDEYTWKVMRKYHILSWLNGCMTITFPKRDTENKGSKIICVDIPEIVKSYLPVDREIEYFSHIQKAEQEDMQSIVSAQYEHYKKEASLIVTSRLHCASPCIAAGIPTVIIRDNYETNFGWIDRYTKLYTTKDLHTLDWNQPTIELEEIKEKILENARQRLESTFSHYKDIFNISQFYEEREKTEIQNLALTNIKQYIKENWTKRQDITYAIWGFSLISVEMIEYIKENYPNARLVTIFDKYRSFEYQGIKSQSIENMKNYKDLKILVMGAGACNSYRNQLDDVDIYENQYILCY